MNNEEHYNHIKKNLKLIKIVVITIILIGLYYLYYINLSKVNTIVVCILIFLSILSYRICIYEWNRRLLNDIHYVFIILIIFGVFSNNKYILAYFLSILLFVVISWEFNNDTCIFGPLDWGGIRDDMSNIGIDRLAMAFIIGIYSYKIYKKI
jgi:hypothetical protein